MLKEIFSDRAFRVQALKILILGLLLVWPFQFHNAIAKKSPPAPEAMQASVSKEIKQPQKKEKKKKKKETEPAGENNQLTRETNRKLIHHRFEVPASIRPAVDFWKMVYTQYDRRFEVFHDSDDLGRIYSVLDFSELYASAALDETERRAERKARIEAEKDRIRAVLLRLSDPATDLTQLNAEEKKIFDLFKDDPDPLKFKWAAENRIRSQTGIKDKFVTGIANSGAYMEEIEDIFASYGLPAELTRLVFVESMFNTKARSKVGASGVWQFMPSTGKLYGMNIDGVADERNDPILATHAAARLLKSNYEALGTWPLAINAYNSGQGTMKNAVRNTGSDRIEDIIRYYRGGVYGFASRNFFPSFLAALEVANRYPEYFGKIERKSPVRHETYYVQNPVFFNDLASAAGSTSAELADLNPHYNEEILSSLKKIPAGYAIRVPQGSSAQFTQAERQMTAPVAVDAGGNSDL